jgi:uncharacterized phage protein (TIGR01671 family)
MSRVIKFRGLNFSGNFVFGYLVESSLQNELSKLAISYEGLITPIQIGTESQFTGLYDVSGEEIYEGDIVEVLCYFGTSGKHPKSVGPTITVLGVIEFKDGKFDYNEHKNQYNKRVEMGNATDWYRGYCQMNEVKVVGNIHQNPELLK